MQGPLLRSAPAAACEDVYELGAVIGQGASGVVRRAVHRASGRPVAAKFIRVWEDQGWSVGELEAPRDAPHGPLQPGDRVRGPWGAFGVAGAGYVSGTVISAAPPGGRAEVELDVLPPGGEGTPRARASCPAVPGGEIQTTLPSMVRCQGRLRHPCVLGLLDWRCGRHAWDSSDPPNHDWEHPVYSDNENKMIAVFELAAGGDLQGSLRFITQAESARKEAAAAGVMRGVLRGLAHVHAAGVIHHDFTLGNVLLSEPFPSEADAPDPRSLAAAVEERVRIADFGISKLASDPEPRLTSLQCMAPELHAANTATEDRSPSWLALWGGEPPHGYDGKADVWAAGVMSYALLCGRMPFKRSVPGCWDFVGHPDAIEELLEGPRFAEAGWTGVSAAALDFVRALLRPDPARRPTAAQALRHAWLTTEDRAPARRCSRVAPLAEVDRGPCALERGPSPPHSPAQARTALSSPRSPAAPGPPSPSPAERLVEWLAAQLAGEAVERVAEVGDAPAEDGDVEPRCVRGDEAAGGRLLLGVPHPLLFKAVRSARARWLRDKNPAVLRALLALLPQFAAGWAHSRHVVDSAEDPAVVRQELALSGICLRRCPKCFEAWQHRAWLLRRFGPAGLLNREEEARLSMECAERHPRNYLAWEHFLSHCDPANWPPQERGAAEEHALRQPGELRRWAALRPSDHSAMCCCQALLRRLARSGAASPERIAAELQAERSALAALSARRPGHEGHWAHRRWLLAAAARFGTSGAGEARELAEGELGVAAAVAGDAAADPTERRCAARFCLWVLRELVRPPPDDQGAAALRSRVAAAAQLPDALLASTAA